LAQGQFFFKSVNNFFEMSGTQTAIDGHMLVEVTTIKGRVQSFHILFLFVDKIYGVFKLHADLHMRTIVIAEF